MPDAKNNAKLTGDTHPPEVEDIAPGAEDRAEADGSGGESADRSLSRDVENEGRAGKGINQAGYLKDKEGGVGKDKP